MPETFSCETVKIPSISEDVYLDVWLYKPAGVGPFPVVVAGHGLTVVKEAGFDAFGEKWATDAGYASLIFDYRFFGKSGGKPRNLVVYSEQLEDYRSVIKWARQQPHIFNNDKIVVMGSATSGISVVNLALSDASLAGAMAHSPVLDGYATLTSLPFNARLMFWATIDMIRGKLGLSPIFIKAIGHPGEFAFLNTPSSYPGFISMFAQGDISFDSAPNLLTPRLAYELMGSAACPAVRLKDIHCKMLIVAARDDDCIPINIARDAAANAPDKVIYLEFPCGHYDVMRGGKGFDKNINAQIEFLQSL
ncbi:alpha/beta-hydrolase [Lentinula aff. lateritia]|uniref:Alpha/beta-hydrolase n=1 Tax=Lentinula aff. lateritia TaxID=2804960 RepID=A0ACC1TP92_9AGAR|nr:alpha/beta-hydrolase [Lentinula aff. lateritia]